MPNETEPGGASLGGTENLYPNRIEDPEKAHVMALAGDKYRRDAQHHKGVAEELDNESIMKNAEYFERMATEKETEAGREYDEQHREPEPRIDDPEKAHVMAEAGDGYRTQAAELRKRANDGREFFQGEITNREWANRLDKLANDEEESAGRLYEVRKNTTRIEDPEKAHVMATAGDKHRSKAASHRKAAESPFHGGIGSEGEFFHSGRAEIEDRQASEVEEEAGRQYDAEQFRKAAERIIDRESDN